eukprot:6553864-Prymnesium_polylepis.1
MFWGPVSAPLPPPVPSPNSRDRVIMHAFRPCDHPQWASTTPTTCRHVAHPHDPQNLPRATPRRARALPPPADCGISKKEERRVSRQRVRNGKRRDGSER